MAYRKKDKFGMGLSRIEVRVQRAMDMDAFNVLIFQRNPDGKMFTLKPMELEWVEVGSGHSLQPTMTIGGMLAGDLLDALIQEMGTQGIKTQRDSKTEGILEAQTKHLSDMRRIVFMEDDDGNKKRSD